MVVNTKMVAVKPRNDSPTVRDVARLAGVSPMTVSRVLNQPQLVKEATRERVQEAIQDLDYVVNELARQIGTARSPSISILALNVATTPYSVDITMTVERVAREHGWKTYIVNTFSNDPPAGILDALLAVRPQGVIFATMGHRMVNVHERLIRNGVVLANCQTTQKGVAAYVPDDEKGQYEGVCKLLEKGYRRPICVHLPSSAVASDLRRKGMERAFREFNVTARRQTHFVLGEDSNFLQTVEFLDQALAQRPRPDCLICANDRVAFVAYQHLMSLGLRIPKDLGILGFDNMVAISGLFLPPLSTVRLPHDEIGRAAALHIIQERSASRTFRVSCPFVGRKSF